MAMDRGETGDEGRIGSPVHARGGEVVGRVKEVREGWFKVNAPGQPDYWLGAELVGSQDEGRILLTVDLDDLYRYKRYDFGRGPTVAGVHTDLPPDYRPDTTDSDARAVPEDYVPGDTSDERHAQA